MQVEKSFLLAAHPEEAWNLLKDVERVARCIPGVGEVKEISPLEHYEATLTDRVGPFKVRFRIRVASRFREEERAVELDLEGQDRSLGSTLMARFTLALSGGEDGQCRLTVRGETWVTGTLGTLGMPVIRRKVDEAVEQFARNLSQLLTGTGG